MRRLRQAPDLTKAEHAIETGKQELTAVAETLTKLLANKADKQAVTELRAITEKLSTALNSVLSQLKVLSEITAQSDEQTSAINARIESLASQIQAADNLAQSLNALKARITQVAGENKGTELTAQLSSLGEEMSQARDSIQKLQDAVKSLNERPTFMGGGGLGTDGIPVDDDYAKFTANRRLEGRSASEVRGDLDLEAGTDFPSLTSFNDHSARHEDGGDDEISLASLSGTPAALTTHEAATDPHTGYQKESEREAASGYAGLDASSKVIKDPANATATATASKIPIADGSGKLDSWVSDGSTTVKGLVEAAVASEVDTGTDATRAVTPDALAGSDYGIQPVGILVNDSTALTTGDGKAYFRIPSKVNGWNVILVAAHRQAGTGLVTINIYNVTDSQDILSTALTIDDGETDSSTAATPAVINATYDDVATGDWIRIDVDGAGTGTTWLYVELQLQAP